MRVVLRAGPSPLDPSCADMMPLVAEAVAEAEAVVVLCAELGAEMAPLGLAMAGRPAPGALALALSGAAVRAEGGAVRWDADAALLADIGTSGGRSAANDTDRGSIRGGGGSRDGRRLLETDNTTGTATATATGYWISKTRKYTVGKHIAQMLIILFAAHQY